MRPLIFVLSLMVWCTKSTYGEGLTSTVIIDQGMDGQEVQVTRGDIVVLRLPENPTTGVRWSFEQMDGPVRLAGDDYEQVAGGGIGAQAIRKLSLQFLSAGRVRLRLKRWQEWGGESTVDATFQCIIDVFDGG